MPDGRVVTFYSYKGGTGRSMALANVAWILASNRKRVLLIDWDLEAPGLHRYIAPFLQDAELRSSDGLIDFVIDYAAEAARRTDSTASAASSGEEPWYASRTNLLRFAVPVVWDFPEGGRIDFVPSGRQGPSYATRVNSFEWQVFYERLQGGKFLDSVTAAMRSKYDFVLIDSRTGVSDTSGICTVQMPDTLVVFFTLNHQSIGGASAIAESAAAQRPDGALRIYPVPTRVDRTSEKKKLDVARAHARTLFDPLLRHIHFLRREDYWDAVEVDYEAFYAYEEILAPFAEQGSKSSRSMLASMHRLAEYIAGAKLDFLERVQERQRRDVVSRFARLSKSDGYRALECLAAQYEEVRAKLKAGSDRTRIMNELVGRVAVFAEEVDLQTIPQELFARDRDGLRLIALALIEPSPAPAHLDLALASIRKPRSPFEQYHALVIVESLFPSLDQERREAAAQAIQGQIGKTITESDPSRWNIARDLLQVARASSRSPRPDAKNDRS